jgi:hypothetical protein
MDIKIVSWNLCGLSKLTRWPSTVEWLEAFDIILIQESLQVTPTFHFNDVTRFDFPAVFTQGRARGGLIVALKNSVFGAAKVSVIIQEEHVLALEISSADAKFIVVNVYIPVHSHGFDFRTFPSISSHMDIIISQFPSIPIVMAGENIFGLNHELLIFCTSSVYGSVLVSFKSPFGSRIFEVVL